MQSESVNVPSDVAVSFISEQIVEFDGHKFGAYGFGMNVPHIYMAYHARRGDCIAADLLNKGSVRIYAENMESYWPMPSDAKEQQHDSRQRH